MSLEDDVKFSKGVSPVRNVSANTTDIWMSWFVRILKAKCTEKNDGWRQGALNTTGHSPLEWYSPLFVIVWLIAG